MNEKVEVSVVCITYNQEKYVSKMLESLVNRQAVVLASTHYGEIKDFAVKDRNFITAAMDWL